MPQPQQSPEPASSVESQSILIIRKLLLELGSASALRELERNGHSAHLERDLGLGSLERVELMVRLDAAFSVRLPDAVVGESETVRELVDAVIEAQSVPAPLSQPLPPETSQTRAAATATSPAASSPAAVSRSSFDPATAETLVEILCERARARARSRSHPSLRRRNVRPITYGELLRARLERCRLAAPPRP